MSSQPSRHDRRKLETRARIREAATDLFAAQGYDATKVSEICERADVARQTFFNHFPAKREVLRELFAIGVDMLAASVDAACEAGATTRERLGFFYRTTIAAAVDVGPFAQDLVAHIVTAFAESEHPDHVQGVSAAFRSLVDRGLELGDVTRRRDPAVLAELTEGALVILVRDWVTRGGFDPVERAAELADAVADALEKRPDEA